MAVNSLYEYLSIMLNLKNTATMDYDIHRHTTFLKTRKYRNMTYCVEMALKLYRIADKLPAIELFQPDQNQYGLPH